MPKKSGKRRASKTYNGASASGSIAGMQRAISDYNRASRANRMGDYKRTGRVIDAAFGNTATYARGTRKRLNRKQADTMDKILKVSDKLAKAGRRDVRRVEDRNAKFGTMGGMLNDSYGRSEANIRAYSKQGKAIGKAGVRLGKNLSETSKVALGIATAGVQEARAGAQEAAADALAIRAQADAETSAQMQFQLEQTKLQHQLELEKMHLDHELYMKRLKYQEKAAEGSMSAIGNIGMVKQQILVASSVAQELYSRMQGGEDAETILNDLVARKLLDQADADSGVVQYLARTFQQNQGAGSDEQNMAREVMAALENMPGFLGMKKKDRDRIEKYVRANVENLRHVDNIKKVEAEAAALEEGRDDEVVPTVPSRGQTQVMPADEDRREILIQNAMEQLGMDRDAAERYVDFYGG